MIETWESPYFSAFRKCVCVIKAAEGGLYSLLMTEYKNTAGQFLDQIQENGIAVLPLIDQILIRQGIEPVTPTWPAGLKIKFRQFHPNFNEHITITPEIVHIPWNIKFIRGLDSEADYYTEIPAQGYWQKVKDAFPSRLGDQHWMGEQFDPRNEIVPYFNYSRGGWSTLIEAAEFIITHKRNGDPVIQTRLDLYHPDTESQFVLDVLGDENINSHFQDVEISIDRSLVETSKVKWDAEEKKLKITLPGLFMGRRSLLSDNSLPGTPDDGSEPRILGNLSNCSPFCGGFWNNADAHTLS